MKTSIKNLASILWTRVKQPFNGAYAHGYAIVWAALTLYVTFALAEHSKLLGVTGLLSMSYVYTLLREINIFTYIKDFIQK